MNARLLKIGIALLVSGSAVFVLSASAMELGHPSSDSTALVLTPALMLINILSVFVGIPIFLVGIAFMIGIFATKFPSFHVVFLSGIVLVSTWVLFIFSRFS